jgi:NAD(P)H-dependent FMN reductase
MIKNDYIIIVASVNQNMKLALTLKEELESMGKSASILDVVNESLPMFSSIVAKENGTPSRVEEIAQELINAKAYVIVSPEYNYNITPVLSNLIAWLSTVGDDFRKVFTQKVILNATFSGGGGKDVLNIMRRQFTSLGAIVVPREILVTFQTPLKIESAQKILSHLIEIEEKMNA